MEGRKMKTCSITATLFLTLFALSIFVSSQTDSCSSNPDLSGLPFNTSSSLHCVSAWNSQNYILRYEQASSELWSFILSAPDSNAYIAVGFSPSGMMIGSSAIVGWISDTDGSTNMKQYYLEGQSPGLVHPDQGNLQIASSTVVSRSSRIYLAFQLNISLPLTGIIYAVGPTGVLPSSPSYVLRQHADMVATRLNYVTGQTSDTKPHSKLRKSHGVLVMLGWGILMIIGAMFARYSREWDPFWFYAHICVQLSGFILGIAGIIAGLVLEDRLSADVSTHKSLGITILVFGCLQVMALLARPDKSSKVRKYWNWYHYGLGRTLMALAIGNVFYGIHLGDAGKGWNAAYAIVIAFLFVTAVVLEVRLWKRK